MKIRLLSLVLAVLLVFPGAAVAEVYEWPELKAAFSECTIEMLYSIKTLLDTEIASREDKDKEVPVPVGTYIVGDDIPAGTYTVTGASNSFLSSTVRVLDQNGKKISWAAISNGEQIGKLVLLSGYQIEIEDGAVIFSTYKGLGF